MCPSEQERIASRRYNFPEKFDGLLESILGGIGYSLSRPGDLARSIEKLSTFYIENPEASTPWNEKWAQAAYLTYFFPLNWCRSSAVLKEARRVGFLDDIKAFIDFGSGLSALAIQLKELGFDMGICVERAYEAISLHVKFFNDVDEGAIRWQQTLQKEQLLKDDLVIFSYVLTELKELPSWALNAGSLLIVEPSTRVDGRRLLKLRKELLPQGFYAWAPCPHQLGCPLYEESETDWCHDRIHFEGPSWFSEIEKLLPMKNRTITFSYLLLKKVPPELPSSLGRLVGDLREEKGKSRQLVCRGPHRQFLAWMHRHGRVPVHPRGELMQLPEGMIQKSNELRLDPTQGQILRPWSRIRS